MEYKFNIIVDDEDFLIDFLKRYNHYNKTDFEIDEFIYDEVVFARLKTKEESNNRILQLGIQYGKESTINRIKRKPNS